MSDTMYLLSLAILFGTVLTVFGMKYGAAAYKARSDAVREAAYRALAEKAVAAQADAASALVAIQAVLPGIGTRLAAIEKILKEVE